MTAALPPPSTHLTTHPPGMRVPGSPPPAEVPTGYDPLRLCIFATVALLGWALGPFALVWFAGLGFLGYRRARQAGLTRSRCVLRDTRLVLAYLGLLTLAGAVGAVLMVQGWVR